MSVHIEIRTNPAAIAALTIEEIAALEHLRYGISDGAYVLAQGETGKYNILFDGNRIGRGFEVTLEERKITIALPLPNTPHDIALCYRLTESLCRRLGLEQFSRDGEEIPLGQAASLITLDLQASVGALRDMEQQIEVDSEHTVSVFGALNPIVVGPRERTAIGGTLDGFEAMLDQMQRLDAWYAVPRFFRLEDGPVVGMYFIGEDMPVILPRDPAPAYQQIEGVDGYYVRIPGHRDIPYALFWDGVTHEGPYDATHDLIRMSADQCAHLGTCCTYNMRTRQLME